MNKKMIRVGISKVSDIDDLKEIRNKLFDLLALLQLDKQMPYNARILIKVNLCLLLGCETGATVDPNLVRFFIDWLLENCNPKEIIIAESDATALDADKAYQGLAWDQIFNGLPKVKYLNLSKDELVKVKLDGLYFDILEMSKTYMEADFLVSFAKLKTHTIQGISGVMKNLFGAIPEKLKVIYHPQLDKVICDLVKVRPPDFCLVDGLIAQEGPGPVSGIPKIMGLIVAGANAVSVDHCCARLMEIDPLRVPHIKLALKNHLGSESYEIVGCCLDEVKENFTIVPAWRKTWNFIHSYLVPSK